MYVMTIIVSLFTKIGKAAASYKTKELGEGIVSVDADDANDPSSQSKVQEKGVSEEALSGGIIALANIKVKHLSSLCS